MQGRVVVENTIAGRRQYVSKVVYSIAHPLELLYTCGRTLIRPPAAADRPYQPRLRLLALLFVTPLLRHSLFVLAPPLCNFLLLLAQAFGALLLAFAKPFLFLPYALRALPRVPAAALILNRPGAFGFDLRLWLVLRPAHRRRGRRCFLTVTRRGRRRRLLGNLADRDFGGGLLRSLCVREVTGGSTGRTRTQDGKREHEVTRQPSSARPHRRRVVMRPGERDYRTRLFLGLLGEERLRFIRPGVDAGV